MCCPVACAAIPGISNHDSILHLAVFAASLPHLDGIDLLPYHTTAADKYARMNQPYKLVGAEPLSAARMAEIAGIVCEYGKVAGTRVKQIADVETEAAGHPTSTDIPI